MGLALGHTASCAVRALPLRHAAGAEGKGAGQFPGNSHLIQFHRPDSGNASLAMGLCGPEIVYTHQEFTNLV